MTTPNADEKFFMNDEFVLFKSGIPSQWYPSPFTIDGVRFVNCEQRMMYMKGKVFGDEEAMREVMLTEDPKRHKEIGRSVKNFDVDTWSAKAYQVVVEANYAKYSQNPELRQFLIDSGSRKFVECAPYDKIWGNGLNITQTLQTPEAMWEGTNLLGKAIMDVREMILAE
jgi:ribA/ribD-fused uncharacterized protein